VTAVSLKPTLYVDAPNINLTVMSRFEILKRQIEAKVAQRGGAASRKWEENTTRIIK
jgi:hypothetical protein